jgi:hypothetical protein
MSHSSFVLVRANNQLLHRAFQPSYSQFSIDVNEQLNALPRFRKLGHLTRYGRVVLSTGLLDRCIEALLNQNDASSFALLNTPVLDRCCIGSTGKNLRCKRWIYDVNIIATPSGGAALINCTKCIVLHL